MGARGKKRIKGERVEALGAVPVDLLVETVELLKEQARDVRVHLAHVPPNIIFMFAALRRDPRLAEAAEIELSENAPTALIDAFISLSERQPDIAGLLFSRACLLIHAAVNPKLGPIVRTEEGYSRGAFEVAAVMPINNLTVRFGTTSFLKRMAALPQ